MKIHGLTGLPTGLLPWPGAAQSSQYTAMPYNSPMQTVTETEIFQKYAEGVWSESERAEFINWIAANPLAGDVVPGSNGCRKVRWSRSGMGKRGGARVIYFNEIEGRIWLLIVYAKAKFDNLPAEFLAKLKYEVEHG
jgi:hypothetical protein